MVSAALIIGRNSVNAMKHFRMDPQKSHRMFSRKHRAPIHVTHHSSPPPTSGSLLSQLARPALFTFGFSATVFGTAAIIDHENIHKPVFRFKRDFWVREPESLKEELSLFWSKLDLSAKTVYPIIGLNALVLGAWQLAPESSVLYRWFLHHPRSTLLLPMLLSAFSHAEVVHAGFNMYALDSFAKPLVHAIGPEQFVALFLSGGVFASLTGMAAKLMANKVGPSLGASGAVFAVVGATVAHFPDSRMGIILLPFSFRSAEMLMGIMAVDVAGLVLGWRRFDHAAHLGGVLFGLAYANYGEKLIWREVRPKFLRKYEELKREIMG